MQNTELEDFCPPRIIQDNLFFFFYWVLWLTFPAHSALKSCANVPHTGAFSITVKKKPQMLQKFPLPWVWTCPAPAVDREISLLWQSLAVGVSPFLLSPWLLVWQVPAVLPVPTQTGGDGVGWEGELRNFGLAPLAQQGSQEGDVAGAKHNANMDCCFWKGGNPGATTKALLCSWDSSTVCCPWAQQN